MDPQNSAEQKESIIQRHLQTTIEILRLVKDDYQHARGQLEAISSAFKEKESRAAEQLNSAQRSIRQTTHKSEETRELCLWACFFGYFELYIDNHRIEHWSSSKAKSVLKYLIAQRGRHSSKELLMETWWVDSSPDLANKNLRTAIHTIRRTLSLSSGRESELPYILFKNGTYLINPDITLLTDDEEFEQNWIKGRELEKNGDLEAAIKKYALAENLYRGDYLEDALYEEWTFLRREALKDIYLAILGKLAENAIKVADYESCIDYCHKIITKDPCCEDSYRHLMYSYARLGQRNRALHWYAVCEKTINAELETCPEDETVALFRKLLNNESL